MGILQHSLRYVVCYLSTTTPFWGQGFLQALTPELKPSSLGSGLGFGMQPRPGPLEQCVRPRLGVYEGGRDSTARKSGEMASMCESPVRES